MSGEAFTSIQAMKKFVLWLAKRWSLSLKWEKKNPSHEVLFEVLGNVQPTWWRKASSGWEGTLMIHLGLWGCCQYLNAVSHKPQTSHYFAVISGHTLIRAGVYPQQTCNFISKSRLEKYSKDEPGTPALDDTCGRLQYVVCLWGVSQPAALYNREN